MMRAALVAVAVFSVFDGLVLAADTGAKLLDDMTVKAFLAGDVDAIVAVYAPDATVYPPGPPSVAKGSVAIRKVMADFLGQFTVREFRTFDTTYETAGDLSVGWGQWVLVAAPKAGGDPVRMEARFTSIAKKLGGKWLYVSDHASLSPPVAPNSR
jgi:ketosteroid isomerase-like protein